MSNLANQLEQINKPFSQKGAVQRILIVDDSRLQRRIMRTMLERWGYDVTEAASALDALERVKSDMPDMLISDWMMPGMTGLDLCQKLRALAHSKYCYFILVTSKSEKAAIARGLEDGADDFLTKPVNASELHARIAAGERILAMQDELRDKNQVIGDTLAELQTLYNALDSDLIEAKKLQQSLIRDRNRRFETAEVSLLLRSAGHVGGDLVGYFPAGPDQIGIYGIDVSGHWHQLGSYDGALGGVFVFCGTRAKHCPLSHGNGANCTSRARHRFGAS